MDFFFFLKQNSHGINSLVHFCIFKDKHLLWVIIRNLANYALVSTGRLYCMSNDIAYVPGCLFKNIYKANSLEG